MTGRQLKLNDFFNARHVAMAMPSTSTAVDPLPQPSPEAEAMEEPQPQVQRRSQVSLVGGGGLTEFQGGNKPQYLYL